MMRAWVLGALLAVGCKNGPSEDQCKQLLDHLTDLEFKKAGAAANTDDRKAEIAKQKTAVTDKVSGEFIKECKDKMARARVECALAASELEGDNSVAKCDESK